MVLKKLTIGMTVYEVKKTTGLQRFNEKWSAWPIYVKEIDYENNKVLASWNSNPYKWYSQKSWKAWRIKPK